MGHDVKYDGHINRNIRVAMALIDMTKPYIDMISYNITPQEDKQNITFQVNGCKTLNEVRVVYKNGTLAEQLLPTLANNKTGFCNYLGTQSVFTYIGKATEEVTIEAIVDQDFGTSRDPKKVDPIQYANKP